MFSSRSVQIAAVFSDVFGQALPNLCRSFYNETKAEMFFSVFAVALLAEGVDRNLPISCYIRVVDASPSSRRAWIEIPRPFSASDKRLVALLAEGVDRNLLGPAKLIWFATSPSSRRAWIEIQIPPSFPQQSAVALLAEGVDRNILYAPPLCGLAGRPPRGGRG